MTTLVVAGHAVEFADRRELGQGGPETCTMCIDDRPVVSRFNLGWQLRSLRFHPTPLEFGGDILIPLRRGTRFYLVRIDPRTLAIRRLSRGFSFMRLLRISGAEVEFSTASDDREIRIQSLVR
ncbi:MAG TPA: hypothetical protein VI168_06120 [Croceibacterium sp.]